MAGDERIRHCSMCDLDVVNVDGLSRDEARDVLARAAGGERVCARMRMRADGTIITRDCPVGLARLRRRVGALFTQLGAAAMMLASFGMITSRSEGHWHPRPSELEPMSRALHALRAAWSGPPRPIVPTQQLMILGRVRIEPPPENVPSRLTPEIKAILAHEP